MHSTDLSPGGRPVARGWEEHRGLAQTIAGVGAQTHRRFSGLAAGDLSATLVLPARRGALGASLRGARSHYPASVVKLFHLAAAQAWLEAGKLSGGDQFKTALAAMIRQSSNDATSYLVDLLTGTTSGPELPLVSLKNWLRRRRAINRCFANWGCPEFAGINLTQKTWNEAPYGRERQSCFEIPDNRNRLSSDAAARLLLAIDRGEAVSKRRSAEMMKLLARPIPAKPDPWVPFDQVHGFLGEGLPKGSRLWSKAGWSSRVKHDAAIVQLPHGRRFILVVFTSGQAAARSTDILPFVARKVAAALARDLPTG
jgi:hypothetical protein